MTKIMTLIGALFISQAVFAATDKEVVKTFETAHNMTCTYSHASKYQFCLNYICKYKKYYSCANTRDEVTLVLKIRSIQIPGETPENTVTDSYVE